MELNLQVSPEEIMSREVELGCEVRLNLSLRVVEVVRQQQCSGLCLCDSAQAQRLKQQLRSAQVAGQWRGDTAITLPLFWRRSAVSPVSFGWYQRSSLHSVVPPPPPSPSLISHLASVDVRQNGLLLLLLQSSQCCFKSPSTETRTGLENRAY